MTQAQAVIETIDKLGGIATLNQINQHIFEIEDCVWKTKTPFASVRRIVQQTAGIYKIKPGLYALETHRKQLEQDGIIVQTEKNKESEDVKSFNHSYYQGLLLEIGRMRHLDTFVPNQDKNKKFIKTPLGEIRTLQAIPHYSYSDLVERSSTIDVIWFNDHKMPHSFYEIEHTTDIQNSLLKFDDLKDFSARMVIVADESVMVNSKAKWDINPSMLCGRIIVWHSSAMIRLTSNINRNCKNRVWNSYCNFFVPLCKK